MITINADTQYTGPRSCRVAYTLGNYQPVVCTLIDDQPMFYMDYTGEDLDDVALDSKEMSVLEHEVAALQREMQTLERFTREFQQDNYQKTLDMREDLENIGSPSQTETNNDIAALLNLVELSRTGKAYLELARSHNVKISYSQHISEAEYSKRNNLILINPTLDMPDQILLAARELRRHWQNRNGALVHPLRFQPDNAVLINRAQAADLAVSMVRIGWELQLNNYKDVWQRLENSSLADLGRAFAREAFNDFRTLNNGMAAAAVFEAWFLSERCRAEDKNLIKQMLADHGGYVFDLDDSGKAVTAALIAALGTVPFGKNYLAHHANTIMEDPIFSEVRDRSNANFLWFIKFERSFRETERELQPAFGLAASGVRRIATSPNDQDAQNVNAPTAEIISLFPEQNGKKKSKKQKSGKLLSAKSESNGQGAEIVYLRRWSAE